MHNRYAPPTYSDPRQGALVQTKVQPSGVLPYPASFYNPLVGAQLGTVERPRLAANTSRVPNIPPEHYGNRAADASKFFYPDQQWYVEKYLKRKENAVTSYFDPLGGYLRGETLPFANRPVKVIDLNTGMYAFSDKPTDQRSNSALRHKYYEPLHNQHAPRKGLPIPLI